MRIKSGFRDYYDSVQATGQDQSLLYVRKRLEERLRDWPFDAFHTHGTKVTGRSQVVGFCGRVYPALKMIEQRHPDSDREKVCYSVTDVDAFMDEAKIEQMEFYRVIDPYSAFQEIAMFLANLAVPLKEIPQIPDKVMVEAKGFDKKWSFRTEPRK